MVSGAVPVVEFIAKTPLGTATKAKIERLLRTRLGKLGMVVAKLLELCCTGPIDSCLQLHRSRLLRATG